MHVLIATSSNHGDALLDPEYCEKHPLGGSETAVIKMTQALRHLGVEVTIATQSTIQMNTPPDVFISLRHWKIFNSTEKPGRLNYLWCHDDADQPIVGGLKDTAVAARVLEQCDGFMMLSHYQAARWRAAFGIPANKIFLTSNGIDLPLFRVDASRLRQREPRAYYASTPFRGLTQLLNMWPMVHDATGGKARLVICSSVQVYGDPELPEYQSLYKKAHELPGVEYLGSVSQQRLREVAASCRALAYPCIFPETSCIAAMEAMASGCVVVGTAVGALPETAWRNPLVPIGEGSAEVWVEDLLRVLTNDDYYEMLAQDNLRYAALLGWAGVARRWLMRFRSDLTKRAWSERSQQNATASP